MLAVSDLIHNDVPFNCAQHNGPVTSYRLIFFKTKTALADGDGEDKVISTAKLCENCFQGYNQDQSG